LVLADVVVVNVVGVIDMIDDHVRFGTYHQLDFDHNLERHPFDGVIPPSSSTHLYRKALQSIVVSCHHRKNSRNSTNWYKAVKANDAARSHFSANEPWREPSCRNVLEFTSNLLESTSKE